MITEEEKENIRKKIKKGYPEGEIKSELARAGFTDADIKEIFKGTKADMKSWYFFSAVLLLIIGAFVFSSTGIISLFFFGSSGFLFFEYYKAQRTQH